MVHVPAHGAHPARSFHFFALLFRGLGRPAPGAGHLGWRRDAGWAEVMWSCLLLLASKLDYLVGGPTKVGKVALVDVFT